MLSVKKFSILGGILVVASAVTAAVLPSKENKSDEGKFAANGTLTASTLDAAQLTCSATAVTVKTCFNTPTGNGSDTTVGSRKSAENATTGSDNA